MLNLERERPLAVHSFVGIIGGGGGENTPPACKEGEKIFQLPARENGPLVPNIQPKGRSGETT